jgi:hypothetical protein
MIQPNTHIGHIIIPPGPPIPPIIRPIIPPPIAIIAISAMAAAPATIRIIVSAVLDIDVTSPSSFLLAHL